MKVTDPNIKATTRSPQVADSTTPVRATCPACSESEPHRLSLPSLADWDVYTGAHQISQILGALQGVPQVAVDVETTGLQVTDRIRTVQLAALSAGRVCAVVLCLETPDGEVDEDARAAVRALLPRVLTAESWAYSGFDQRMLASDLGIRVHINNAAALHHLVDQRTATQKAPLKTAMAARFATIGTITGGDTLVHSVMCPRFTAYAAFDAAGLLILVQEWLQATNWQPDVLQSWLDREARIEAACNAMTQRGLPLDELGITEVESAALELVTPAAERIADLEPGLNVNSPLQLRAAYERRGVAMPMVRRKRSDGTSAFTPSTSHRDVVSDDELVLAVNQVKKGRGVLTELHRWEALADDGRIHGQLRPLGAQTGRWTSAAPNLQNVSKGGELSLRRAVRTDPGFVFVQSDLSAIEYRVAAALSGDVAMLRAFADGEDLHMIAARALSGIVDPTSEDRNRAKAIGFGKLYGQSVAATAVSCGVTFDEMAERIQRYDDFFPQMADWTVSVQEATRMSGLLTPANPYGRHFRVPEAYMAVNYMVQSTAREVFCDWLLNVVDAGFGALLVAGIHDELLLEVPQESAEAIAREVGAAAGRVQIPGHPEIAIVADSRVAGRTWASAYEDPTDFGPPVSHGPGGARGVCY